MLKSRQLLIDTEMSYKRPLRMLNDYTTKQFSITLIKHDMKKNHGKSYLTP